MKARLLFAVVLTIVSFVSGSIEAALSNETQEKIKTDIKSKKFKRLGKFLKNKIDHTDENLDQLQAIGDNVHSQALANAATASKKYKDIKNGLGLSTGGFLQSALFIETDLKKSTKKKDAFLPKKRTGMERPIEYDAKRKATFIVLDGTKSAFLGQGFKKRVYKAIDYHRANPEVVARAEQSGGMDRELAITKHLQGAKGVIDIKGFGHRKGHTATYSKLYRSKDLKTAAEKKIKFSLFEKLKIAEGMLQGVASMHHRGVVHRDVSWKNFFLSIPDGKAGKRDVEAVIADFGWSRFVKGLKGEKAQANGRYTAPEGFFRKKMKGKDYFKTDVYATGLVLYRLFYGKKASWTDESGSDAKSVRGYVKKLVGKIYRATESRRKALEKIKKAGQLTPSQEFEYLILNMVHPDAHKRGSAKELHEKVKRIIHK